MLSRKASRRKRAAVAVAVAVAVFVAGAGIGVGIVLATRGGGKRRTVAQGPAAHAASAVTAKMPPLHRARPAPRAAESLLAPGAGASFAALESRLGGAVGLAVAPLSGGTTITLGAAQIARAWSTSKVPVLVTLILDAERGRTTFDRQDRAHAAAALEQSDNSAIEALFSRLEQVHGGLVAASLAVQRVVHRSGDAGTVINTAPNDQGFTTYGQTEWSLSGEIAFFRSLANDCLLSATDTRYVIGLMRSVVPSQRWGAGSAGYDSGLPVAFKGGWGPENGRYQVRQTAIVGSGGHGYAVSLLALPAGGSFDEGTSMLTELATWARQHVNLDAGGTARGTSTGCPPGSRLPSPAG